MLNNFPIPFFLSMHKTKILILLVILAIVVSCVLATL